MVTDNHFLRLSMIDSRNDDYEEIIWEKHRPYIEFLSQVNNSCVFVSLLHVKYLFISPNFKNVLRLSLDGDINFENDLLEECIHPDDL